MTIRFPDVSSYTPNVDPAAYPVLIARATLSTSVVDKTYATFKARSAAAGTLFLAYHWLNHGNLQAQAAHCFSVVGPGVPLMMDCEDEPGNTGYDGPLTVADITGFAAAYRALGGTVNLAYIPAWYWSGAMSMADLRPLIPAGLHLVSSNYPNAGYTENGPGWNPYYTGAPTPVQWQYADSPFDMNAFRGTVAEYAQLVGASMFDPQQEALIIAGCSTILRMARGFDTLDDGKEPNQLFRMVRDMHGAVHLDDASIAALAAAVAAHPATGTGTDPAAIEQALRDVLPTIRLTTS